jgi:hypothetical protein
VTWHLLFLLVRGTIELGEDDILAWLGRQSWYGPVRPVVEPVNRWATRYENTLGIDQTWCMFASMARGANFPAVRIFFTDGTHEDVLSDDEPADPNRFFRIGQARLRKLENALATQNADQRRSYKRPMWEQYVRWRLTQWRRRHPDDPRRPARLTLVRRRFVLPEPGHGPTIATSPQEFVVARFNADGDMLP